MGILGPLRLLMNPSRGVVARIRVFIIYGVKHDNEDEGEKQQ